MFLVQKPYLNSHLGLKLLNKSLTLLLTFGIKLLVPTTLKWNLKRWLYNYHVQLSSYTTRTYYYVTLVLLLLGKLSPNTTYHLGINRKTYKLHHSFINSHFIQKLKLLIKLSSKITLYTCSPLSLSDKYIFTVLYTLNVFFLPAIPSRNLDNLEVSKNNKSRTAEFFLEKNSLNLEWPLVAHHISFSISIEW